MAVEVFEFDRQCNRMWEAIRLRHVAEFYAAAGQVVFYFNILRRMANALGDSDHEPVERFGDNEASLPELDQELWGRLLVVTDESFSDKDRAHAVIRAFVEQARLAPDVSFLIAKDLFEDQQVSTRDKDNASAALTGAVDARFSLNRLKDLKVALEREGIKRQGEEFVQLLCFAVFESLAEVPASKGLRGLRSQASNVLRRQFETKQHEFETRPHADLAAVAVEDTDAQAEMAKFALRELRIQTMRSLNRMMEVCLSDRERRVFLMAIALMSNDQIAEKTERDNGQIRQEKLRARRRLQRHPEYPALEPDLIRVIKNRHHIR